jgi:hypothetical protein
MINMLQATWEIIIDNQRGAFLFGYIQLEWGRMHAAKVINDNSTCV